MRVFPKPYFLDDVTKRFAKWGKGLLPSEGELISSLLPDDVFRDSANKPYEDRAIPVLLEITPVCDFQNNKSRLARLLAGLAVPIDARMSNNKRKNVKAEGEPAVRKLPPILLSSAPLNREHVFMWHARFLVAVPVEKLYKCKAIGRLREQPLADIQAWAAGYGGRPAYLSVR